jgi:hypothetical protein
VVEAPHPGLTLRWLDEGLAASALVTDRPPLAGAVAERAADVAIDGTEATETGPSKLGRDD